MKPANRIKTFFKNAAIRTNPKMDEAVLNEVLMAQEKVKEKASAICQPTIWRIIMKSPITKLTIAAVIIVAVILGLNFVRGPYATGVAFAEAVQQIRQARTVTYTTELQFGEQVMRVENAYKEPGLNRAVMPGGLVAISDLTQRKAILINHSEKQYTERSLDSLRADQTQDFFERLRTLPDQANEVLAKKEMNGRMIQGYRVIQNGMDATLWIDEETRDLVRVEGQFPNAPRIRIIGTHFKYDIELDDALFSLTPPDGYTPKEPPEIDRSEVNYKDLINLLRWWATTIKGGLFPPSLDPVEFAKAAKEMKRDGSLSEVERTKDQKIQLAAKLGRGIEFVIMMRPENDWHYAGKGVKLGDADTAIFWYRPEGSETYRVIYGDLSVKDVAPEDLPK